MIQLSLEMMRMIRPIQHEYECEAARARLVKLAKLPKRTPPFGARLNQLKNAFRHPQVGLIAQKRKPIRG